MTNAYINNGKKARGGKMQGYNAQLDESLGMRRGAKRTKQQSDKDRRDESKAMSKSMDRRAYAGVRGMDKGRRKMAVGGKTTMAGDTDFPSELLNYAKGGKVGYDNTIKKAITILDEDKVSAAQKAIAVLKPIKSEMPVELREQYDKFVLQEITIGEMLEALGFYDNYAKGGKLSKEEIRNVEFAKKHARGYVGNDFLDKNPSDRDILKMINLKGDLAKAVNGISELKKQYGVYSGLDIKARGGELNLDSWFVKLPIQTQLEITGLKRIPQTEALYHDLEAKFYSYPKPKRLYIYHKYKNIKSPYDFAKGGQMKKPMIRYSGRR